MSPSARPTHAPPMPSHVGLAWELTTVTGWGVYGTHVLRHLAVRGAPAPILLKQPARFTPDPLDAALFAPYLAQQQKLLAMVSRGGKITPADLGFPVLKTLLPGFRPVTAGRVFFGKPDIGVIFFENTRIDRAAVAESKKYARIVAGSTWNRDVMVGQGVNHVELVLQGIDPVLFHPMPRRPFRPGTFTLFSGGKLEARKGQDLVLAAFKRFHARHPDSVLITAWQNAWPELAADIAHRGHVQGVPEQRPDGTLAIEAWAVANGLPQGSVLDMGWVAHKDMPRILAACDAAVFPSRNESGTNLPAMECMAMGLPVVVSANTGHLDLIGPDGTPPRVFPLRHQRPVAPTKPGWGTDGWGESSVDELDAVLEVLYTDRQATRERGDNAAAFMQTLTWEHQVDALAEVVAQAAADFSPR